MSGILCIRAVLAIKAFGTDSLYVRLNLAACFSMSLVTDSVTNSAKNISIILISDSVSEASARTSVTVIADTNKTRSACLYAWSFSMIAISPFRAYPLTLRLVIKFQILRENYRF